MISAAAIYAKTAAGGEEVKVRKLKLAPKLRTMLILVDGAKPALVLREEAERVGAPPDFLEQLESLGLVSPAGGAARPRAEAPLAEARSVPRGGGEQDPVERFRAAQKFMNETAVNALGIKSFFFTLKLEKCATVDDLRELLQPYPEAIAKGSGEEEAEALARRLEDLLGP